MNHDEEMQLKQIQAINQLLVDQSKSKSETIKQLKSAVIVVAVCFTIIICCMIGGFFWYESQFEVVDTKTETTVTELTTEGENANINNVTNGNMYNDNATHNE